MSEWSEWRGWNGGECPVDRDAEVETCWTDGASLTGPARIFNWNSELLAAYRVKREPVVETVRQPMRADACRPGHVYFYHSCGRIPGCLVYETRDGIPDMTTLRWEDAE